MSVYYVAFWAFGIEKLSPAIRCHPDLWVCHSMSITAAVVYGGKNKCQCSLLRDKFHSFIHYIESINLGKNHFGNSLCFQIQRQNSTVGATLLKKTKNKISKTVDFTFLGHCCKMKMLLVNWKVLSVNPRNENTISLFLWKHWNEIFLSFYSSFIQENLTT